VTVLHERRPWAGKQIIEDYLDTGRVQYRFRHYPFLGEASYRAAEAADCADEQGKFLEWHAKLADVWEQSGDHLADDRLRAYAEELGLDTEAFNACYATRRYEGSVLAEKAEGVEAGVRTTPTMFFNSAVIEGEKTFEEYQAAIEQALAQEP
jgi:protein-disulfide isomerase